MENLGIRQENKKSLQLNPEYFGAYLNMARHNIFLIVNSISKKFNISEIDDDAKITSCFITDKNNRTFKNNQNYIFSNLLRFMTIVRVFDDELLPNIEKETISKLEGKNFDELSKTLKMVFTEINDFRNDYTHYYSISTEENRKLNVSDELKSFLNINYNRAIEYTKYRFSSVYVESDFDLANNAKLFTDGNIITQDGIVFLTSIFLDRENAFQFINKIIGLKGTQNKKFTAKREVMSAFCVKLPHEKFVSENNIQAFSLEIINELNKCPKILYNSIDEDFQKVFQPKLGKEEIEEILKNSVPESIDNYEEYIESITKRVRNENRFSYFALKFLDDKNIFKNIRFQVNLGKLILDEYPKSLNGDNEERRVVENVKAFGRLQDFRNDEENILTKINRSNKVLKFEQFAPHYNFDNNKIGIKIFNGNTKQKEALPIFTVKDNSKNKVSSHIKQQEVTVFLSANELPKIILLEYLEKGKTEELIMNFINTNDTILFNLDFIHSIKEKLNEFDVFYKNSQGRKSPHAYFTSDEKGNKIIDLDKIENLQSRKTKLNLLLKEYSLNDKQIPTRIVDYWLNIKDVRDTDAFSSRIKLIKRDCINRLKDVKRGNSPKIGEMATYLAKDIIDMIIDPKKKEKITSFYYDKMQQCLALYADSEKKNVFLNIVKELDFYGEGGHPFLNKIEFNKLKYTQDIYKSYLEEKGQKLITVFNSKKDRNQTSDQSWLQENFYFLELNEKINKYLTVVKMPENISKIPYSIIKIEKEKNSFEDWYHNILKGKKDTKDNKKPIDLPTNLFDEYLKIVLQNRLHQESIVFDSNTNYSKLFKLWWSKSRNDSSQSFYSATRCYDFEEKQLKFELNSKNKFIEYCTPDFVTQVYNFKNQKRLLENLPKIKKSEVFRTIHRKISNTEKTIRLVQEEDMLMLLMFEQLIETETNLKLKEIDKLLNETIEIKEKITSKLSFDSHGEQLESNQIPIEISKYITEFRKRKEYSVLKKYIHDRRLPELFEYFHEDKISLTQLKIELDSYNKAKETVFDCVFRLEKAIIEKDKAGVLSLIEIPKGHIQHKSYLQWLLVNNYIEDTDFRFLNMVRKTFSHNQFSNKITMELFIKNWNENKFALQIIDSYKNRIEEIIKKIA